MYFVLGKSIFQKIAVYFVVKLEEAILRKDCWESTP